MLNGLDLFSGIGGITLALSEWVRPVAYCEIEPYAAGVLFGCMLDGTLFPAPVYPDIRELTGNILPSIDIVYGGSPCQGFSVSGLQRGMADKRSGLFQEFCRLIKETSPTFVFWENTPGAPVDWCCEQIEELGYSCRKGALSAAEVGGNHIRRRVWVLAHADSKQMERRSLQESNNNAPQERQETTRRNNTSADENWRERANRVYREAYGVPYGVERVEALGNSVDVRCAKEAFKRLMGVENGTIK